MKNCCHNIRNIRKSTKFFMLFGHEKEVLFFLYFVYFVGRIQKYEIISQEFLSLHLCGTNFFLAKVHEKFYGFSYLSSLISFSKIFSLSTSVNYIMASKRNHSGQILNPAFFYWIPNEIIVKIFERMDLKQIFRCIRVS